ncbi:MAG: 3-isopropylmalate dehydratase large subunit, partial [Calditrichaeota bacterium]|nr:3-isopropylmalate dehydratase large subunit [Calditrichota bacterium]
MKFDYDWTASSFIYTKASQVTIIEKIFAAHAGNKRVQAADTVWIDVDYRSARDFGGPNVVGQLEKNFPENPVADPECTFFTFDTNAPANTTGYADNQHRCRIFGRKWGIPIFDVDSGIGTHVAMEKGLVLPGGTAVGTDSHFNILAAMGCFGQGMGDVDIAYVFCSGRTWFETPSTIRVTLEGQLSPKVTAKDLALFLLRELGTTKALGRAVEIRGEAVSKLDLAGRITLCSLATEAGAITFFLPPSPLVDDYYRKRFNRQVTQPVADQDAVYEAEYNFVVSELVPMVTPPPDPNGARPVNEFSDVKVDSVFVGSCTNGRWEDLRAVADILSGERIKEGVMLKVVPSTRVVYERIIADGTLSDLVKAGAIVTHPGCGGCASGQIGMTGKGEVQVSTSNRNFKGKQGLGATYLASPRTAAWT